MPDEAPTINEARAALIVLHRHGIETSDLVARFSLKGRSLNLKKQEVRRKLVQIASHYERRL